MANPDEFATAVRGISGRWPALPEVWSYTTLRNAEECPRRSMLSRATYPSIWDRTGYPPRAILPALVGDAAHRVLERILRALHDQQCQSITDPSAVGVLRTLGGYSSLVQQAIDDSLQTFEANPRVAARINALRSSLRTRVPEIRHRVQALISRAALKPSRPVDTDGAGDNRQLRPLGQGSYPEVDLRAPELRFGGRADLISIEDLGCTITDYKTGAPDSHHADQVRLYALLWSRDREINPDNVTVQELVVSYVSHDQRLEGPSPVDLGDLADRLVNRVNEVESYLGQRPPPARPAPETCRLCSVRHLCDDYWSSGATPTDLSGSATESWSFVDCQAMVISQNGPRSWSVESRPGGVTALLRTPTETPPFRVGDVLRLIDVAHARDDDADDPILTMTDNSEVYVLESRS